jgi:hypothetical protein
LQKPFTGSPLLDTSIRIEGRRNNDTEFPEVSLELVHPSQEAVMVQHGPLPPDRDGTEAGSR